MAPENEQALCVTCGFCCDGTLFGHAVLKTGEKGNLPDLIEHNVFKINDRDFFRLPCQYFAGKCTIYDNRKADVCGSYRCRLLTDMADGTVSLPEAMVIIRRVKEMRSELFGLYRTFSQNDKQLPLTGILRELGKHHERIVGNNSTDSNYETIQAWCNIFEALLIRHFRPESDFEKMVMK